MLRIVTKISISSDVLDTQIFSTSGPVTSVSSSIGSVSNDTPRAAGVAVRRGERRARRDPRGGNAAGGVGKPDLPSGGCRDEFPFQRIGTARRLTVTPEIELRPPRAGQGPFVLESERIPPRAAAGADLQFHRRLLHDPGVDPFSQ